MDQEDHGVTDDNSRNIGLVTAEFFGTGPESTDEIMRLFDRGEFDLLAVGRPLLSDAEWLNKVRAGLSEEIVDYSHEANAIYP